MTIQEANFFLLNQLKTIYPDGEANTITDWVMEHITCSKKAERMVYKNEHITESEENELIILSQRLMNQEPVQYVLAEAWFYGLRFFVNKNVLIPRPETEELVKWVIDENEEKSHTTELRILDIGTGSGCIPLSLKHKMFTADIWSCDISLLALEVAKKNMEDLDIPVRLMHLNFLNKQHWWMLGQFDIIISNPPYIAENEMNTISPNVKEHEPGLALFVPGDDPLIFYRSIAEFAKQGLKEKGAVYVEINESSGPQTKTLFEETGFKTVSRKDIQGKDRMLKAY
jgi:release factor glutamine methyltransferase